MSAYTKAIVSFLVSVGVVVLQAVTDVYAGGITGVEWLGIVAILAGPAGAVYFLENTPFSPATKAIAQNVAAVIVVVVQGVIGVYDGGISHTEWVGVALLLLSTVAVYVAPNSGARTGRAVV